MKKYRAYVLTVEGDVIETVDLFCNTENDAKARAQHLVDHHRVELWDDTRLIARFEAKH